MTRPPVSRCAEPGCPLLVQAADRCAADGTSATAPSKDAASAPLDLAPERGHPSPRMSATSELGPEGPLIPHRHHSGDLPTPYTSHGQLPR